MNNKKMEITPKCIYIKDLISDYINKDEYGVFGYYGKLNIRPKYQREFVYKDEESKAVINTLIDNLPLNIMYWVDNENGTFEILDGQQRTISICSFFQNELYVKVKRLDNKEFCFKNLPSNMKEEILNRKLDVFLIKGNEEQKMKWFRTINIATKKLEEQELRNINYTGDWLTNAKKFFSKKECEAKVLVGNIYLSGNHIQQKYLETALDWLRDRDGLKTIEEVMSRNCNKNNAYELINYFKDVIKWVESNLPRFTKNIKNNKNSEFKSLIKGDEWGFIYNKFFGKSYDKKKLEKEVIKLFSDNDVTNKHGIFYYVLSDNDKKYQNKLSIRKFNEDDKRNRYKEQNKRCIGLYCNKEVCEFGKMEGDHIIPWSEGGKTIYVPNNGKNNNLQMLCKKCNNQKGNK